MPRKRLKSLVDITKDSGCEPGEYLAGRLKHYIETGDHDRAEKLADSLMPYARQKLKQLEVTGDEGGPLKIKVIIGDAS